MAHGGACDDVTDSAACDVGSGVVSGGGFCATVLDVLDVIGDVVDVVDVVDVGVVCGVFA